MSHWQNYHALWSDIEPPLRPNIDVIRQLQRIIGDPDQTVLLLGVTPEIANAFRRVQAADVNEQMIRNVWPGDTLLKKAVRTDWQAVSPIAGGFFGIVGDGSLNALGALDDLSALLAHLVELLNPQGHFACRLFERPATPFSLELLRAIAQQKASINFHGFKWMIAMYLAETRGASVPVTDILALFNELFPDRAKLAGCTGWPLTAINTIDVYTGSNDVYIFPDREEFIDALPGSVKNLEFFDTGTYDLASCCPIMAFSP